MSGRYAALLELRVEHEYHEADARDVGVGFVIPADARRTLQRRRMLARTTPTSLTVAAELDAAGRPLVPLTGEVLRLGLVATTPTLHNYTVPLNDGGPLLIRLTASGALKRTSGLRLVGERVRQSLGSARPATVRALTLDGAELDRVVCGENAESALLDLVGAPLGRLRVVVSDADGQRSSDLYLHPELRAAGLLAVLELPLRAGLAASPVRPVLKLEAREQHLSYLFIASGYGDADPPVFSIRDEGYAQEDRAQVQFQAATVDAETRALLASGGGASVTQLRSAGKLRRSHKGRGGLRLLRDNIPILEHLPQPGPESATSTLILHLPKP